MRHFVERRDRIIVSAQNEGHFNSANEAVETNQRRCQSQTIQNFCQNQTTMLSAGQRILCGKELLSASQCDSSSRANTKSCNGRTTTLGSTRKDSRAGEKINYAVHTCSGCQARKSETTPSSRSTTCLV